MAISRLDMERQLRNMGGIMTLQEPRQGYFLGKLVKKAKKAVKKVIKSPFGKAALLAAPFLMGGGAGSIGSFFGKGSFNPFMAKGKFSGLGSLLNKAGLVSGTGGFTGLGKIAGIGAASGLAGLLAGQEEEDETDYYRGEGLDIPDIVRRARMNDPEFRFLPGAGYTSSYADGGDVNPGIMGNPAVMEEIENMREFMIMNPDIEDVEDYTPKKKKKRKKKAEGGIMNLEKNPEYKGWKKIYMMSPDAAESHPKHEEFENYLKRKENKKAEGGIMNLGGYEMDLRGGGFVPLGAKEKADDVPARLSKNEFVMTADAVKAAGGGSVDKGADKMYKMMKQLEAQV
jgi:hypothetical protein